MPTDDTTWDTDEVIRYIDNDEPLYHEVRYMARRIFNEHELAKALRDQIGWENYNNSIDTDEVDWEHVAHYLLTEDE